MLIMGMDPGTATTGYGLVTLLEDGNKAVTWGLIETDKTLLKEVRLDFIFEETLRLINLHKPDVFVFEKVFFSNNAKTVIAVGQAQGVMLLAARKANVMVAEYAPGTIKKMITGNGRANKKVVQEHVRKILGNQVKSQIHKKTHFDNAADALAIALTHAFKIGESVYTVNTVEKVVKVNSKIPITKKETAESLKSIKPDKLQIKDKTVTNNQKVKSIKKIKIKSVVLAS